jgi:hypothetical protein
MEVFFMEAAFPGLRGKPQSSARRRARLTVWVEARSSIPRRAPGGAGILARGLARLWDFSDRTKITGGPATFTRSTGPYGC